jgi:hypothetical protein
MSWTVHRQTINPYPGHHYLYLPKLARILSAQIQHGMISVWYVCDSHAPEMEQRHYRLVETGELITGDHETYIATFQFSEGQYVLHLFENETYRSHS